MVRLFAATLVAKAAELPPAVLAQAQLPTSLAGLHLVLPSHTVPLARAARVMEDGPCLRAAINTWRTQTEEREAQDAGPTTPAPPPVLPATELDGAGELDRDRVMQMLQERGIQGIGGTAKQ